MSLIYRNWSNFPLLQLQRNVFRCFGVSSANRVKEIQAEQVKDSLILSGQYVASPREHLMVEKPAGDTKNFCLKCTLGLDVKHTDVLILSQYVRSDGCMLPRRITGLCKVQQKRIGKMVTMAQKAGLMSNLTPAYSKKDPKKRFGWKKYNTYFDESTIKFNKILIK